MNPNIHRPTKTNIPGPPKRPSSIVSPLSNVPSSLHASVHPQPTPSHPLVSAAYTARPSRIPSPADRALSPESNDAPAPKSLPVPADAMPPQVDTLASAAPSASAKPAATLQRPPMPFRPAPLASGATANPEASVSTALAAAYTHTALLRTHSSAQAKPSGSIPTLPAAQPVTRSRSTQPAATDCEAPLAHRSRAPALSSMPASLLATAADHLAASAVSNMPAAATAADDRVASALSSVPAPVPSADYPACPPAQLVRHAMATRTRAASRQHTLAPVYFSSTNARDSPMPGPPPQDDSLPCDSYDACADDAEPPHDVSSAVEPEAFGVEHGQAPCHVGQPFVHSPLPTCKT